MYQYQTFVQDGTHADEEIEVTVPEGWKALSGGVRVFGSTVVHGCLPTSVSTWKFTHKPMPGCDVQVRLTVIGVHDPDSRLDAVCVSATSGTGAGRTAVALSNPPDPEFTVTGGGAFSESAVSLSAFTPHGWKAVAEYSVRSSCIAVRRRDGRPIHVELGQSAFAANLGDDFEEIYFQFGCALGQSRRAVLSERLAAAAPRAAGNPRQSMPSAWQRSRVVPTAEKMAALTGTYCAPRRVLPKR